MESLVCLQILRPPTNSQGTSCPVAGHISPPRFELSDPRFIRKNCVGKNPQDHFLSAKTKKRCQLKCCELNVLMNVVCKRLNVYILYFNMAATQNFLVAIWLVPVSLGQPSFVLVWSGPIRSQEKCIQKWISAAMISAYTPLSRGICSCPLWRSSMYKRQGTFGDRKKFVATRPVLW